MLCLQECRRQNSLSVFRSFRRLLMTILELQSEDKGVLQQSREYMLFTQLNLTLASLGGIEFCKVMDSIGRIVPSKCLLTGR